MTHYAHMILTGYSPHHSKIRSAIVIPMATRNFETTFKHFSRLVIDLHIQWQMFRDLHSDINNYDILNSTAPTFFVHLRSYLYDLLFLSISRFFDLPKQLWNENLCLKHMISFEEVSEIKGTLSCEIERLEGLWKAGIKTWRHKRLSHNDLPTLLDEKTIPDIPNKDIETLVEGISNFARRLESHVFERDQSYEVHIAGWVPQLIRYLRLGIDKKRAE